MAAAIDPTLERLKRRREWVTISAIAVLFLLLTAIEYKLFGISQQLPFRDSIFFLGLVNFNIILFLLLFFLIFRNVAKIFAERGSGISGGSLRAKMIAGFVGFSIVPTTLMFIVSVFYINNSFDKWFSEKMAGVLKSSLEVTNAYYMTAKRKNYHFAERVAGELGQVPLGQRGARLRALRERYSLDAVEYYPSLFGTRIVSVGEDEALPQIPPLSLELLERGIEEQSEASTIHQFENGNLVRVIHPVGRGKNGGAVVVSSFIPLSLITRMDDIATAYEDFRDVNPLEYPVKSIYLIILVLMTLTIMLGATWFGFYLARQLSDPLEELGRAAGRVSGRDYREVAIDSGSREINQLVRPFNQMVVTLDTSERELKTANSNLEETLGRLFERSRYIEVLLSTIGTGVISVDAAGVITMVNRHASKLLGTSEDRLIGERLETVLTPEHRDIYESMTEQMSVHAAEVIQREMRLTVGTRRIPLQMTLSSLGDEKGQAIGKVLVFDDLTPILGAQRAAAWTEVARRIAHEIKNPLTPIRLSAERLRRKFGAGIEDEAFDECIRHIIEQVDSLKNLVNEFNQFARLPQTSPVLGQLNDLIADGIVAYGGGSITAQADPKLPRFYFDPDQLRRILNNLVDNARSAIGNRPDGRIVVRTTYDPVLRIARLEVEDNGSGVPHSLRERIFEPYVTTKPSGTGLGLALVKRMVEDHHGFIRAFSDARTFTRFVIELPVIDVIGDRRRTQTGDPHA